MLIGDNANMANTKVLHSRHNGDSSTVSKWYTNTNKRLTQIICPRQKYRHCWYQQTGYTSTVVTQIQWWNKHKGETSRMVIQIHSRSWGEMWQCPQYFPWP